jgi:hypothetical protein
MKLAIEKQTPNVLLCVGTYCCLMGQNWDKKKNPTKKGLPENLKSLVFRVVGGTGFEPATSTMSM